ncbi:MAG: glutathione S-transferase family protein [Pseudomonadota bacterium]
MYTLYSFPGAGGIAIEAALADSGIPYRSETVPLEEPGYDRTDYLDLNPRGQVPALVLPDGSTMTESAAILLHLADAHPEADLAPPPGSVERAQVMRWLCFFAVNVYEGELRRHNAHRFTSAKDGAGAVAEAATHHVARQYALFEAALADGGPYFLGPRICILDYYVWMLSYWVGDRTWLERDCPKVEALTRAVRERPAVAPLHAAQLT